MSERVQTIRRPGEGKSDAWSRSVSPVSRASRRRWVVALGVMSIVVGGLLLFGDQLGVRERGSGAIGFLAGYLVLTQGLLVTTRGVGDFWRRDLDDRDELRRGQAHVLAVPMYVALLAVTFVALALARPELTREVLWVLATWLFVWLLCLPMAVLAWQEPDGPAPEPAEGVVRRAVAEPVRDALMAAAILLSLAFAFAPFELDFGLTLALLLSPYAVGMVFLALDDRKFVRAGRGLS